LHFKFSSNIVIGGVCKQIIFGLLKDALKELKYDEFSKEI